MTPTKTGKLPREYVVKKFYELGYHTKYNRGDDTYNCSCPVCKEGKSWGRKKRCWYLPDRDLIYCFNCGWSSRPLRWIQEVGGLSYKEIMAEVNDGEYNFINLDKVKHYDDDYVKSFSFINGLPDDAINLNNPLQLKYYENNAVVQKALRYIHERRLDTAINKPESFYLSFNDPIHHNRLIIPFQDIDGSVPFFQSRAFGGNVDGKYEDVRYLSKKQAGRTVFGIDKIDNNLPYIFLFEGPIDACFVRNGVAVAGINLSKGKDLTQEQQEQLSRYRFSHKFVWVLDSQQLDDTSREKTESLLEIGESVFIWPKAIGSLYKDFNAFCVDRKFDEIPVSFLEKFVLTGQEGLMNYKLMNG